MSMGSVIFEQVRHAILRAANKGKEQVNVVGIMISIQHVAGKEYRAVLPDGGEVIRFDLVAA